MRDFLSRVKNAQLTLRPTKCSVGFASVLYLGYYVGNHSLQTKSDLVENILQAPKPTNKQQLRSFLGLIGFYRKFIPNFATVAVPLTDLTKKDQPNQLNWGEAQDRAFETLKGDLDVDLGSGQGHSNIQYMWDYQRAQPCDCNVMQYRNVAIWISWRYRHSGIIP